MTNDVIVFSVRTSNELDVFFFYSICYPVFLSSLLFTKKIFLHCSSSFSLTILHICSSSLLFFLLTSTFHTYRINFSIYESNCLSKFYMIVECSKLEIDRQLTTDEGLFSVIICPVCNFSIVLPYYPLFSYSLVVYTLFDILYTYMHVCAHVCNVSLISS